MTPLDLFLYVLAAIGGLLAAPFLIAAVLTLVVLILSIIILLLDAWEKRK